MEVCINIYITNTKVNEQQEKEAAYIG